MNPNRGVTIRFDNDTIRITFHGSDTIQGRYLAHPEGCDTIQGHYLAHPERYHTIQGLLIFG